MKSSRERGSVRRCVGLVLAACSLPAAGADLRASLTDLSLEQLANIEVTSVAKRVQRLADVAGSVYIISAEDIRRAGVLTLPEALRLAPNLQVARADANQYAITARGFNSVLANKMLVLIDGRTVYSPLFSGVFWEERDLLLEDVERIEVLSGSGGTLYGSNAVNGVINVITRSADLTRGALAKAAAGNDQRMVGARYGADGPAGFSWRAYAKRTTHKATELVGGAPVRDASGRSRAGFRADRTSSGSVVTLQGDVYDNRIDQAPSAREVSGWNLLARYSRDLGEAGQVQWQGYVSRTERDQPPLIRHRLDTADVEFQHLWQPAAGHQLLWGAGWRRSNDDVTNLNPTVLALLPAQTRGDLWYAMAQDEVALTPALRFTFGVKAEHNAYTGLEWLPNMRLAWQPAPEQLLWAAASRSVRAPSRVDREYFAPGIAGGPNFRSEVAQVFELGMRGQPLPAVSYSATLFHHRFDHLRSLDLTGAAATVNNNYRARLTGLETWGQWRISDTLRLKASYVHQRLEAAARPGTAPLQGVASLGNDPRNRATLGVSWDFSPRMELDLQARHVGSLPNPAVPSYTALDARWGWHVRPDLELSVALRNAGGRHVEWGVPASRVEFGRSVLLSAAWRM
jgi:iron complex outermembrane receptor protein